MHVFWTEATIQTNDCLTFYRRTGGNKPPVVLLHGLTDNGACWSQLALDLAADYDLIMPDARGHGQSSVPEQGYGHEDRANDVIALIAGLALDRPVLIGHSMGGLSAAVVAGKAPELMRGALLEDPALLSAEEWNSPLHTTWPLDHAADRERSIEELISRGKLANPRWPDEIFPPWAQAKREASLKVFDWFALAAPDVDSIMAQIRVPTLLITGDLDQGVIVTPAQAAAFQAMNPLVQVAHVPGAGHCLRYEQPATVANLARAFLATCFG